MSNYYRDYTQKLRNGMADRHESHAVKSLATQNPSIQITPATPAGIQLQKEQLARWTLRLNSADRQRLFDAREIASLVGVPNKGLLEALHAIGWQPVQIRLANREGKPYCTRWRHPDYAEELRPLTPETLLLWITQNPTPDGHFDSEVVRKHFTGQAAGLTPTRKSVCDCFEQIGFEYRRIKGGYRRWASPSTPRIIGTRGRKPSVDPKRRTNNASRGLPHEL